MGRRRKRTTPGSSAKSDPPLDGTEKELEGLSLELWALCGFLDSSSDQHVPERTKLATHLRTLANLLSRIQGDTLEATDTHSASMRLLELEEVLENVRTSCEKHCEEVSQELVIAAEIALAMQESITKIAESACNWIENHPHFMHSMIFYQSLQAAHGRQCCQEQAWMAKLASELDFVYSSNTTDRGASFATTLRQAIRSLERHDFLQQPDFKDAFELLLRHGKSYSSYSSAVLTDPVDTSLSLHKTTTVTALSAALQQQEPMDTVPRQPPLATYPTAKLAVEAFLQQAPTDDHDGSVSLLLVVGPQGSGKTHLCDVLEQSAMRGPTRVTRPHLPVDLLGETVGETEDRILALFSDCISGKSHSILVLLDNVECLVPRDASSSQQEDFSSSNSRTASSNHALQRAFLALLSMLDTLLRAATTDNKTRVCVLCTSSTAEIAAAVARFDRVYDLQPPTAQARKQILADLCFTEGGGGGADPNTNVHVGGDLAQQQLVNDLVEMTVGKSYAELVHACRQALEVVAQQVGHAQDPMQQHLLALQERLHMATPASLQSSLLDDVVDLRVMSARELQSDISMHEGDYDFPMLGQSAQVAWKLLQSSIIIPLCRARELAALQNESSRQPARTVLGGVLLEGAPGSGKSEIAMHCARCAASLLPTVKLLIVSCTSLIHKELGSSEAAIHKLFDAARRAAPCIVLMDGLETIAAVRGNDPTTEGTLDRVLSTLLVELDGVDDTISTTPAVMTVIGITQHAHWIDPALKRPGRLEKVIRLQQDWAI